MSWTVEDLEKIDEALKSGALTIRHGDKTITYRSTDDLLKLRERILRYLERTKRPLRGYIAFKQGY